MYNPPENYNWPYEEVYVEEYKEFYVSGYDAALAEVPFDENPNVLRRARFWWNTGWFDAKDQLTYV